jgi:hypothetical protein
VQHRAVESFLSLNAAEIGNVFARHELVHSGLQTLPKPGKHDGHCNCCGNGSAGGRSCFGLGCCITQWGTWLVNGEFRSDSNATIQASFDASGPDGPTYEAYEQAAVIMVLQSGHAFGIRATANTPTSAVFRFASLSNLARSQTSVTLKIDTKDFDFANRTELSRTHARSP